MIGAGCQAGFRAGLLRSIGSGSGLYLHTVPEYTAYNASILHGDALFRRSMLFLVKSTSYDYTRLKSLAMCLKINARIFGGFRRSVSGCLV